MATRLSQNPVYQILDQNNEVIYSFNNDGSIPVTDGSPGVAGPTLSIKKTLTSAQLLALKATPIEIIPAPGAGKAIVIDITTLRYIFVTTGYTLNAGTFRLFYGAVANTNPVFADVANGLITAAANRVIIGIPSIKSTTDTDAHLINVNVIAANDGGAEYTLGAGTLQVNVFYNIIQLP